MKANKFFHCGWEDDESGDTYDRDGEQKSQITIYFGEPGDGQEWAVVVHRHIGELDVSDPVVQKKIERAEFMVESLNDYLNRKGM